MTCCQVPALLHRGHALWPSPKNCFVYPTDNMKMPPFSWWCRRSKTWSDIADSCWSLSSCSSVPPKLPKPHIVIIKVHLLNTSNKEPYGYNQVCTNPKKKGECKIQLPASSHGFRRFSFRFCKTIRKEKSVKQLDRAINLLIIDDDDD